MVGSTCFISPMHHCGLVITCLALASAAFGAGGGGGGGGGGSAADGSDRYPRFSGQSEPSPRAQLLQLCDPQAGTHRRRDWGLSPVGQVRAEPNYRRCASTLGRPM